MDRHSMYDSQHEQDRYEEARRTQRFRIFNSGVLLVFGVICSVFLWHKAMVVDVSYQEVMGTVVDVQSHMTTTYPYQMVYEVTVNEGGIQHPLHNVKQPYAYYNGKVVTVFKSQGKLYEDLAGVKSSTEQATLYFVSLAVDLLLVCHLLYPWLRYRKM